MNIRQGTRRKHFYHKPNQSNLSCSNESALHNGFKLFLFNEIQQRISDGSPLTIEQPCVRMTHEGNLLRYIHRATCEEYLPGSNVKPDIALLDQNDKPFAVVEVVVTHPPEQQVINYLKDNGIYLVRYNLSRTDDWNFQKWMSEPEIDISLCKCEKCQRVLQHIKLGVLNIECKDCGASTKVSAMFDEKRHCLYEIPNYSHLLSSRQIALLRNSGVRIDYRRHPYTKKRALFNLCSTCGHNLHYRIYANRYFIKHFETHREEWMSRMMFIDLGLWCEGCSLNNGRLSGFNRLLNGFTENESTPGTVRQS